MPAPKPNSSAGGPCSLDRAIRMRSFVLLLLAAACWLRAAALHAHPVPRGTHDRILQVRLTPEAVLVDYRLEVDQWTIVFQDLPAVAEKADLARLSRAE